MSAPPAIHHLRAEAAPMERSLSHDIREEREDLKEAAEQTLNLVMDLTLDGVIKWVSASWKDVVGTEPDDVTGKPIEELMLDDNKDIFKQAVESMQKDDSKSQIVRFTVNLGSASKLLPFEEREMVTETEGSNAETVTKDSYGAVELEAQGIMVFDRSSDETKQGSHTMWMVRPWVAPREIKMSMPAVLIEGLGSGAELLASYFNAVASNSFANSEPIEPPTPILCRICERQIPPWFFEKHSELCVQEHKAEMEVQMAQESLTEHRHAIVKVLDCLEARKSRPLSTAEMPPPAPQAEYKGLPIGPSSQTSSASGSASPVPATRASRDASAHQGQGNHRRTRSFAVRRPQARIVELLLDLCDTALEISTPAVKEIPQQPPGQFRTQSPGSESRISQVRAWQSPTTNTLDQEQGLAVLCADTEKVANNKIDAVFRHRRILEYSERIRMEFHRIVQEYIEDAIQKGERVAAGLETDSTEGEDDEVAVATEDESMFGGSYDGPLTSTLSQALREEQLKQQQPSGHNSMSSKTTSIHGSTHGSNSPRECPTPKSLAGTLNMLTDHRRSSRASTRATSRRGSIYLESGNEDSDAGSFRSSSVMSRSARVDSPMSDFGHLRRQASSRQRNRRSMVLPAPGTVSPQRQESPSRPGSRLSSSPLRISKPRVFTNSTDGVRSPIISPMLSQYEFMSPSTVPHHHRRKSSANNSHFGSGPPPSPRLSSIGAPQARAVPPSIKDFEIIKPISKGAFGSVYLSKKKSTGDYFAIKVLKKADMVAKNQVTNVKAERAIMMWQGESDFVAKLYWTFSSKDYLYLVMEYLNGGDCASLIKVLGGLPEDWAKKYLGEVIQGVTHLHERNIIHRDLKPDNLLIDQKGHLKLTDFGLSRMGLIGRQKRVLASGGEQPPDLLAGNGPFARSSSIGSSRSASFDFNNHHSPGSTPIMTPDLAGGMGQPSYFSLNRENSIGPASARHSMRSDSGQSDSLSTMFSNFTINDQAEQQRGDVDILAENHRGSPEMFNLHQVTSHGSTDTRVTPPISSMLPPPMALFDPDDNTRRFVGTPDYLAPETVKGLGQDETSDWWSVGCILFEFLYGFPPFHGETPEHVFENILARKISWPDDDDVEVSAEAKDLINKLLCMEPSSRLGANSENKFESGGAEIRAHPWFADINWDTLLEDEAQFVPAPENLEDTEYFDTRGATLQTFAEEMEDQISPQISTAPVEYPERPHDALSRVRAQVNSSTVKRGLMPLHIPPHVRDLKSRRLSEPVVADDFGNFTFKNLPVLEKANKDVIQKLRADALAAQSKSACVSPVSTTSSSNMVSPEPKLQGSPAMPMALHRTLSSAKDRPSSPGGQSQATPSPSRQSQPSSPLLLSFSTRENEARKKSGGNSGLSQQSSLHPQGFFDPPKISPSLVKAASVSGTAASSPIKARGSQLPLTLSPQRSMPISVMNVTPGRTRAQTLGSQEGSPIVTGDLFTAHKRRSGVFDMSPSSSDNEQEKANALLRVQRRRQSSRRLSHINFSDGPIFRPLDVLICESTPSYRLVMVKLLEKLRCRIITVSDGAEATRVASSDIKFDIIMMEFKLPSVNGADVARMIRNTKNVNSTTPIIAVTGYVKELQKPHFFDELIEKPPTMSNLTEVLCRFCHWKAPSPGGLSGIGSLQYPPSGLRLESRLDNLRLDDSPSSTSSTFAQMPGMSSSFRGSSRGDSIGSSLFGDTDSAITNDDVPVIISRKATGDWGEDGLGLNEEVLLQAQDKNKTINRFAPQPASQLPSIPHLLHHRSAPPNLPQSIDRAKSPSRLRRRDGVVGLRDSRLETAESGDDEDEILGNAAVREKSPQGLGIQHRPRGSKLGTEMMRTNSRGSVVSVGGTEDAVDDETISNISPCHVRSDSNISPGDSTGKISPMPKGALTPPTEHPEETAEDDDFKTPKPFKGNLLESGSGSKSGTDSEEPTPRPRSSVDYLSAGGPSPRRSGEVSRASPRRSGEMERK